VTQQFTPDWRDEGDDFDTTTQAVINGKNLQIANQAAMIVSQRTQIRKLRSMLESCHVSPDVIDQALSEGS
jgi:CheY-specific phosphatase CheX